VHHASEQLPIQTMSYTTEPGGRHLGPFAQDFHEAFALGTDETTIGHLGIAWVSPAQALERRTQELQKQFKLRDQEIDRLRADHARLLHRIEPLEARQ
jgi:hypothetical protein